MPPKHDSVLTTDRLHGSSIFGLLDVLEPRLSEGRERVGPVFFTPILARLLGLVDRVMVTELRAAKNAGLLEGPTPTARFDHFVDALTARPELAAQIRARYPLVFERAFVVLENGLAAAEELRARLAADRAQLADTFFGGREVGEVVGLSVSGDPHRRGRGVARITFASGDVLFYKPRPLALDVRFAEILRWLNERGAEPSFEAPKMLDRGDYGWMGLVPADSCADEAAVRRFYRRLGGLVAVTHTLGITDLHGENLIASGEHPMLVDLECAFQPQLDEHARPEARAAAGAALCRSVVGTGLVPTQTYFDARGAGLDISGVGAAGAESPVRVPMWVDAGTDAMRLERRAVPLEAQDNGARLGGAPVDLLAYADDVDAGFTETYRLLMQVRDAIPIEGLEGVHARVLLRSTNIYTRLSSESGHPKVSRDAESLDRFFDKLQLTVAHNPKLGRVVHAEKAELYRGDVPVFTAPIGGRSVHTGDGERLEDFFARSGIDVVRERIANLSEEELARERWVLRASIAACRVADIPPRGLPSSSAPFSAVRAIEEAKRIGEQLLERAIDGARDTTWIGVEPVGDTHFSLEPLTVDLYDGLAGVALFLGQLGAITGDRRFAVAARRAAYGLADQIEDERFLVITAGGFAGWGGLVYAFHRLAELTEDPSLNDFADRCVEGLREVVTSEEDTDLDVLAGLAGGVAVLLATGRDRELAIAAGDRLAASEFAGLTGFSHGAAGVAWALLALFRATGGVHYREAAERALAYERRHFLAEHGNWADLRDNGCPCQSLWCHGAPGVALGRLDTLDVLDDDEVRREIRVGVETTLAHGFGFNHSLCHGDLGNLDILRLAALRIEDPNWAAAVEDLAGRVLESVAEQVSTGVPGGIESPGLMTGLAGIGYGLLRLAAPERVPNVLLLATRGEGA